jgi:hypothetical protein
MQLAEISINNNLVKYKLSAAWWAPQNNFEGDLLLKRNNKKQNKGDVDKKAQDKIEPI